MIGLLFSVFLLKLLHCLLTGSFSISNFTCFGLDTMSSRLFYLLQQSCAVSQNNTIIFQRCISRFIRWYCLLFVWIGRWLRVFVARWWWGYGRCLMWKSIAFCWILYGCWCVTSELMHAHNLNFEKKIKYVKIHNNLERGPSFFLWKKIHVFY